MALAIVRGTSRWTARIAALSLAGAALLIPASANATTTQTFDYTGAAQTWTVPASVTVVSFDLFGASGDGDNNFPGGLGGHATAAAIPVSGPSIQVNVGGQGHGVQTPGFNGGGPSSTAFPGGGATDVRVGGTTLADRVLVAGGGGGAGNCHDPSSAPPTGGDGGGMTGGDGQPTGPGCGSSAGAGGGTQTDGGAPGPGAGATKGEAGAGGSAGTDGGGGGGGGWFGGGGGGTASAGNGGSGGGGGSGYGPPGTVFETGVQRGNGVATVTYVVDAVSSGPSGPTNGPRPTFGYTADSGTTVTCSIDQGTPAYGPCSGAGTDSPASNLADGSYTFRVKAVDPSGPIAVATRDFTVDTQAPSISIDSGPSDPTPTNNPRPSFGFSAETGAAVECSIDQGTPNFGSCSSASSHTPSSPLADGAYTLRVRATDAAGNPAIATRDFTVDGPPTTTITGPHDIVNSADVTFELSADQPATFECRIDAEAFKACDSPKSYTGLADGPHKFEARATDAHGNVEATPASVSFTVDTTPAETPPVVTPPPATLPAAPLPETTIGRSARNPKRAHTHFRFHSSIAGSSFTCQLDDQRPKPCDSPQAYRNLDPGHHVFSVAATSPAGATDPTPATARFRIRRASR